MNFSVIISVWKRPVELDLILCKLDKQVNLIDMHDLHVQVIICDSYSGKEIDIVVGNAIDLYKSIEITHVQTDNILSKKRNVGTKEATGDYLIYLDDDCVPSDNFLLDCLSNVKKIKNNKIVICGEIRFKKELVRNSNYYFYRDSRHPEYKSGDLMFLNAWTFVAMNYMVSRKFIVENSLYYSEEFYGYGAEDHDYGYKLLKSGFEIIQGKQKIWHYEFGGTINKYAIKIYHTAKGGMANLKKVNPELYNNSSKKILFLEKFFSKKNFFSIFIYSVFFNSLIYNFFIFVLTKTDKYSFLYFNIFFRFVILLSYVKGIRERENVNRDKLMNSWYD